MKIKDEEFSFEICEEAVEAYLEDHEWTEKGWSPVDDTKILKQYTEYTPTDEAINEILEHSPIIEIGAGNGYWAKKINQTGGDIIAIDPYPKGIFPEYTQHYEIKEKKHTYVTEHPNRTVLLCHPPGDKWVTELLELMCDNQRIIFVGEWGLGADATPRFFEYLRTNFQFLKSKPIIDWATQDSKMYVFKKEDSLNRNYSYGSNELCRGMRTNFDVRYENRSKHMEKLFRTLYYWP